MKLKHYLIAGALTAGVVAGRMWYVNRPKEVVDKEMITIIDQNQTEKIDRLRTIDKKYAQEMQEVLDKYSLIPMNCIPSFPFSDCIYNLGIIKSGQSKDKKRFTVSAESNAPSNEEYAECVKDNFLSQLRDYEARLSEPTDKKSKLEAVIKELSEKWGLESRLTAKKLSPEEVFYKSLNSPAETPSTSRPSTSRTSSNH